MNHFQRLSLTILFTGALGFFFHGCYGDSKSQKIDGLVGLYSAYGKFNGSVLVAEKGMVILKKGYGMANAEWDQPNKPDTKFRLGSITKQFTSMLIMQLVSEVN
jgi:CubicO group peptidase (beta-lactamase class C family)